MSITLTELKLETTETYKNLTLQDWKNKSEYRGITRRSQYDFDNLLPMYVEKISNIREQLRGDWSVTLTPIVSDKLKTVEELGSEMMEEIQYLLDKETRLIDKFATCLKEVQMRKDGDVIRTNLHDQANYYIDYVNGNDASDGLTTGNSWKTITKYTTTTVRTAGDIAFLRANITWNQGTEAINIEFDEDGTVDDYIKIIGCDASVNDPWVDSSDVKPIIDFQDTPYAFLQSTDLYWWFERFEIRQSSYSSGSWYISLCHIIKIIDVDFLDSGANSAELLAVVNGSSVYLDGCTFTDGWATSVSVSGSFIHLKGCTLDAGAVRGSYYGIYASTGGLVRCEDCSFAPSNAFGNEEVYARRGSIIWLRNCVFGVSESIAVGATGVVYSEDQDATFESHKTWVFTGTIIRGTTSPRAGGADSFAIMAPNTECGPNSPLVLGDKLSGFAKVWVATNAASTITIYVRVDSAWDAALTAAECYIKASYLSDGANADRVELQSSEQIANNTNWTALTVTIPATNPKRDGWVYVWFYLEEYEDATEKVDVDIKPVIS